MRRGIGFLIFVAVLCVSLVGCKSSDYKKAVDFQNAEDYAAAAELFGQLGEYKDATDRLQECNNVISYNEASELLANKDYESAAALFETLGSFRDSSERLSECNAMIEAIQEFEAATEALTGKNQELDAAVTAANDIVISEDKALNEELRPTVETAISDAKSKRMEIPTQPETADEIKRAAEEMNGIDYADVLESLQEQQTALERSIQQYALVNEPSESYVIQCLETVPGITGISAATEDNDPNNGLGKDGSYTAAVYFSHENVDQSTVYGDTIIEKGTDGGGQIEVYRTEEDAIRRRDYLSAFDGSMFASGSHTVIGTVLIRTSNNLTASQQKQLEADIIAALTNLDS